MQSSLSKTRSAISALILCILSVVFANLLSLLCFGEAFSISSILQSFKGFVASAIQQLSWPANHNFD